MTKIGSGIILSEDLQDQNQDHVDIPQSSQDARVTHIGSGLFNDGDQLFGQVSIFNSRVVNDTEPQLGGDLDLNEHHIQYKSAPVLNLTASGLIVKFVYGESLLPGDAVYIKNDGAVWRSGANSAAYCPAMGIALAEAAFGYHNVLLHGIMRNDSWNWFVGSAIYLSTTMGALTQTQPQETDNVIQVLGIATHADRIYFNPSIDYITHI